MMMLGVMWMMAAVMVGFMLGRMSMYGQLEVLELADGPEVLETVDAGRGASGRGNISSGRNASVGGTVSAGAEEGRRRLMRRGKSHRTEEQVFWSVGSPVSGVVTSRREGERAVALIYPEGDFLYAPVAGKVTKLFPMGNAFRLAVESGEELHLRVGDVGDDLMGRYYRPRVVQNEFVAKGKMLLEFDREGLEAEGIPAEVAVWVEGCAHGGIRVMADGERARIGEEILRVTE